MPRVVSANDQEKEKEHRIEQVRTYKFYKIKARGKYKTVPDFFYVVKNHFNLFSWPTKLYNKNVPGALKSNKNPQSSEERCGAISDGVEDPGRMESKR